MESLSRARHGNKHVPLQQPELPRPSSTNRTSMKMASTALALANR
jgi:hypothetical protein